MHSGAPNDPKQTALHNASAATIHSVLHILYIEQSALYRYDIGICTERTAHMRGIFYSIDYGKNQSIILFPISIAPDNL
jgi:hypothetical protein